MESQMEVTEDIAIGVEQSDIVISNNFTAQRVNIFYQDVPALIAALTQLYRKTMEEDE